MFLLTSAAPCRDGCKKKKLLHQSCSHRKNQFVKTVRRRSGVLKVHTGTIDGIWKMLKRAIPPSVNTLKNGRFNPILWTYVRCWQRRWEHSMNGCLAESTAQILNQMAWRKNTRSVVPKPARNSNFTKNTAQIEEAKNKEIHENHREYHCFLQNAGELRCKIMLWSMKNVTKPRNFEHLVHVHMPKKVILLARFPTRRDDLGWFDNQKWEFNPQRCRFYQLT